MTNNLPANLSRAIDAMAGAAVAIDASSGDFNYLKLTKAGEWVHGAEDDEVDTQSVFAVDTESFFAGFQAWADGSLEGEEIRLLTEPPVTKADLPDVGAEWKALLGFQLVCIDGADLGLQLVYKTTSKGGITEINTLMKSIVAHVKSGKHDGLLIPEIKLAEDSYRHKKYGKIYTPVINVVGWVAAMPTNDAKPEVVAEPEPEIVAEAEAEAPRRRRRA